MQKTNLSIMVCDNGYVIQTQFTTADKVKTRVAVDRDQLHKELDIILDNEDKKD